LHVNYYEGEGAMIARFRSWWKNTSKTLDVVVILMLVVLVALVVVIALGYTNNWSWAGLRGKTLYDWLQLLIIPAVLAVGGYLFNYTTGRNEQKAAQLRAQAEQVAATEQAETERYIALDNQREASLKAYIDSMSELLLHENLRGSDEDDEVQKIARVRTLTVLPRLDGKRKSSVLQFLYESGLINKDNWIIDLRGADLSKADLSEADLYEAYLSRTDLSKADLYDASLNGAILSEANLSEACLAQAILSEAKAHYVKLCGANLYEAFLKEADLQNADLREADLRGAFLIGTNLSFADLSEANLNGADLHRANLHYATLAGAKVTTEQLDKAKSLQGATMPDGTKHD
jgi:uncharacterized protein YjbI with pentapeptide repeats